MIDHLIALGVDHTRASQAVLAQVACQVLEPQLLQRLRRRAQASELALVSTCNRTEVYATGTDAMSLRGAFLDVLVGGASADLLAELVWSIKGSEAAGHLFAVAAGLESMVVGEDEVQHQVRLAHHAARAAQTMGPVLDATFRAAIATGRRVRTETRLGDARRSLAEVAVRVAVDPSRGHRANVAVVGSGAIATAVVRRLAAHGISPVVVGRSPDRARTAAGPHGQVRPIEELDAAVVEADVLISGTSASEPLLTRERLRALLDRRAGRSLVLVDLSVSRDVEPAAASLPGLCLFDLGELARIDASTSGRLADDVAAGRKIVEEEVRRFDAWMRNRTTAARLALLRRRAEDVASQELSYFFARHPALGKEEAAVILRRALARGFDQVTRAGASTYDLEMNDDLSA